MGPPILTCIDGVQLMVDYGQRLVVKKANVSGAGSLLDVGSRPEDAEYSMQRNTGRCSDDLTG